MVAQGSNWKLYLDRTSSDETLSKSSGYGLTQFVSIGEGDINLDCCKTLKQIRIRGWENPNYEVYELRAQDEKRSLCGYLLFDRRSKEKLYFLDQSKMK